MTNARVSDSQNGIQSERNIKSFLSICRCEARIFCFQTWFIIYESLVPGPVRALISIIWKQSRCQNFPFQIFLRLGFRRLIVRTILGIGGVGDDFQSQQWTVSLYRIFKYVHINTIFMSKHFFLVKQEKRLNSNQTV